MLLILFCSLLSSEMLLNNFFLILLNFFNRGRIDGVVVCQEFEQVLLDAWREEEEQAEKRKAEVTYSALFYLLLRGHMTSNDQNIFPPKVSERATDKLWRHRDMAQCYLRMLTSFFALLLCCQISQLLGDLNSVSYWIFFLQKREKRMLANWKLLTRSLLIRERLKKRYDTEVHARPKLPSQESSFVIVCVPSPFPSRGGTVKETYRVFWLVARADKIKSIFPTRDCPFSPRHYHYGPRLCLDP